MPPLEIILRLCLFACPLIVAVLAAGRFRKSRSVNKTIYGLVALTALALTVYTAPGVLLADRVAVGDVAMSAAAAPLWLFTVVVCAMTRRSRYYMRRPTSTHSAYDISDDAIAGAARRLGVSQSYSRFSADAASGDNESAPSFTSRRLKSELKGAISAE